MYENLLLDNQNIILKSSFEVNNFKFLNNKMKTIWGSKKLKFLVTYCLEQYIKYYQFAC